MSQVEDLYLPFDSHRKGADQKAAKDEFCNDYLNALAGGTARAVGQGVVELGQGVLRLFDGERRLEIVNAPPKEKPKQDWLVVMNLATDFGNECTIEKRTKKLQELAADTAGKPVTILVQSAVQGKDGKYKLERFALSDGKIQKLESPGNSAGYAGDVEQLLKFANKTYNTQNMALVLDSHGTGNGGLQGDTGNLSLAQLQKSVKKGLEGSGRDKLDLIQFNACLMGQNGVLESTQGLARHVVASAEPEGTGAQGRDFDNKVLSDLLKNPKMSASDLADAAIKHAKDHAADFPTLAHFNMEHYGKFRESLDSFGEKLAKVCEDPKQLAVVQALIKDTFAYGGGRLSVFNFFHHMGEMMSKPSSLFKEASPEGSPDGFLSKFSTGSSKRDLRDFVARILLAISKGELKDEDGSLRKASKAVLIDGTRLTKSFFADGEKRRNVGCLSAFLPSSLTEDGVDDPVISTDGGWRQFQRVILKNLSDKKK